MVAPFFVAGVGVAEAYSVSLDLQVGQLFQRLDQLERRLSGVGQAAAGTQSVMDRFQRSATSLGALDAAGGRMQRTLDLMAGSAKNTNEGMRRLERQLQAIVDKTDRNSQAYAVASANLDRYRQSLRGAEAETNRFASAAGGLQSVMAAVGAAAIVNSFKQAGVEAAMAERKLGFLTTEYGEQAKAQEAVLRVQKQLGISNTEAKQGISNLYAALRPTGIELKNIEGAFLGYAKAARRTGQSNAEISSGMLQLKQALGSGVLQGDELRSIRENAPAVAQAIAAVMGTTVGGLKKLGEQGAITSKVVLDALNGLANSTIPPITAVDRLNAAWTDFQAEIAGSLGPMTSGIIAFGASILEGFQKLPGPIKDLITAMGALALAAIGVAGAIAAIGVAAPAVTAGLASMGVAVGANAGLFGTLAAAATAAWGAITAPVTLAVLGMALLTKAAYDLNEPFRWWVDNLGPALGMVWNDLSYAAKGFGELLTGIGTDIKTNWESATGWFDSIGQGFGEAISKVRQVWDAIPEPLKYLLVPGYAAYKVGAEIGKGVGGYLDSVRSRVEAAAAAQDKVKEAVEKTAKAKELSEKQLKKLAEARLSTEQKLADARVDAEQKIADLRISTAEKAQAWELDIAKERLATERRIADLQSEMALGRQLSAIDSSMAGDGSASDKAKGVQKQMLQAQWDLEQKIIGSKRSDDDRRKAFTEKLEAFKLETTKASGRIQQEYGKKTGDILQGYSRTAAKILETGGTNAGAALEESAGRAARIIEQAGASAGSSGGGVGAGGNFKIGDIAAGELPAVTRALLKTIRFAEGTAGENGYRTMFTGKLFSDMSRHPRQIQRGGGHASDAAGAYQFLSTTWNNIGGGAMTPERQDRGAVALVKGRGVDPTLPQGFTKQVADRLAPEWASFPTIRTGTSYYGQGGKTFEQLKRNFEQNLKVELARDAGKARQAANPTAPGGVFANPAAASTLTGAGGIFNNPAASSPLNAMGLKVGSVVGGLQGPNTRSGIPLGQKAVLNGQPVVWKGGPDWELDTISAAATGGATAAAAANNIVPTAKKLPYPAGFNPGSVGSVDPGQFLGGVQSAQAALDALASEEQELTKEKSIADWVKRQEVIRQSITGELTLQQGQTQRALEDDQARLELMRSGMNPALAEQFIQIDRAAQVQQASLLVQEKDLKRQLEKKDLLPEQTKALEDQLRLTQDALAAEGGITQAIKDQLAARQALKDSPGAKITEKVAQMRAELADTGGMIVSLAGTIESELGSAMSNAISGVISGTTTVEQAFSQMFKNIGDAFIQMATQMIAKALIMKVLGILGGSSGGLFSGNASVTGGGFGDFSFGDFAQSSSSLDLAGLGGSGGLAGAYEGVKFAEGGFVTGTTNAVIGEGGENEYVIPESKMSAAMQRYSAGSRGSAVIPGSGESGSAGETGGVSTIDVSYRVTEVNSVRYVDEATFQAGMRQAAEQGAAAGHRRVFGDLRNSRSQRSRVGIR